MLPKFDHARRGALRAVLAVLVIAVATAALLVGPASSAVTAPHVIAPLYQTSNLELDGYTPGETLAVSVLRNGLTIGTAGGVVDAGGALTINPTECWVGTTPEIASGDTVQVAGNGFTDTAVVQGVTVGPVEHIGTDIVLHGTAADPTGAQLPIAGLDSRIVSPGASFSNGRKTLRAGAGNTDGTMTYDTPTGTAWTAVFPGRSAADIALALQSEARGRWATPDASEVTIAQNPAVAGPVAPCTAPLARNAVTTITPSMINRASLGLDGGGSTPVVISGVSTDATSVSVALDDTDPATAAVTATATPAPATGAQTWSVSIPADDVAGLSDGTLTATPTMTLATGALPGTSKTVKKDTIAPAAPTATPTAGAYDTAQDVTLSAEAGADIHYTSDGSAPTAASPVFSTPVEVTGETTLTAFAIDAAGNSSPVATFAYSVCPTGDIVAPTTTDNTPAGIQAAAVTVTLTAVDHGCNTSGVAGTWYTTDGSDPTVLANPARHPYDPLNKPTLGNGERIRYYSTDNGGNAETPKQSAVVTLDTVAPNAPTPSPAPGLFQGAQNVTLSLVDTGSPVSFFFTGDGTTPTAASTRYTGPIAVPFSRTLKWIAIDAANNASPVRTGEYLITTPAGTRVRATLVGAAAFPRATGRAELQNFGNGVFAWKLDASGGPANTTLDIWIDGRKTVPVTFDGGGRARQSLTNGAVPPASNGSSFEMRTRATPSAVVMTGRFTNGTLGGTTTGVTPAAPAPGAPGAGTGNSSDPGTAGAGSLLAQLATGGEAPARSGDSSAPHGARKAGLARIAVRSRTRLSTAHRQGIVVALHVTRRDTFIDLRLVRLAHGRQAGVEWVLVQPGHGTRVVRMLGRSRRLLPGRYVIQVRQGMSAQALGPPVRRLVRIAG